MVDFRLIQSAVAELLRDFPCSLPDEVMDSLRANVDAGEPELTFDALCSWLYELEARINPDYFHRLEKVRDYLDLNADYLDHLCCQVE